MLQEITGQFIYHTHQCNITVGAHTIPLIIQSIVLNHLVLRSCSCRDGRNQQVQAKSGSRSLLSVSYTDN